MQVTFITLHHTFFKFFYVKYCNLTCSLFLAKKKSFCTKEQLWGKKAMTDDMENSSGKSFATLCSILASVVSISAGYQVGVMSGAVIFMREDLGINDAQVEVLVSSVNFISLLGSMIAGRTSDAIGRRLTILTAALVCMVGAVTMASAPNYLVLLGGRLVIGVGFGYALVVPNLYASEISPSASRGMLTCFPEMCINLGIVLAYITNYCLSGMPIHSGWRVMVALGVVPPVLVAFALPVLPETPQWLVMKNRNEEAVAVLSKTLGSEYKAIARVQEIVDGIEYAKQNAGGDSEEGSWIEIFKPSPMVRRMLITALGVNFFQQATGTDIAVYYSPKIFESAGMTSQGLLLGATIFVGVTKFTCVVLAAFLVEKSGRRKLLLLSIIGVTVSFFVLASSLVVVEKTGVRTLGVVAVIATCASVSFFSVGLGPVCWVLGSEIYPSRIRSKASSLSAMLNRVVSGLVSLTFLSISTVITVPGTFYMYAGIGVAGSVFFYCVVPETKGKSLEEIVAFFDTEGKGVYETPESSQYLLDHDTH